MDNILEKTIALASIYYGERPEYFEEAIKSVIGQSVKVPIALVIDGPLTESLYQKIEQYSCDIDFIFKLEENIGLAGALQYALEALKDKYTYVIRFDTDDINLPERFEVLLNSISKKEYDLVGSNIVEFCNDSPSVTLGFREVPLDVGRIKTKIHWKNPFNHPSVAFNIKSVLAVGGYDNVPFFEDWYLWAKLVKADYRVGNLDACLVRFRGGSGSLSRRRGFKYASYELKFYLKLYQVNLPGKWIIAIALPLRLCTRFLNRNLFKFLYYSARQFNKL